MNALTDIEKSKEINRQLAQLYIDSADEFIAVWEMFFDVPQKPTMLNRFGIINEQCFDEEACILVVCRETNGWGGKGESTVDEICENNLFINWMNEISTNELENRGHITKHPNMWYNLHRWIGILLNPSADIEYLASEKSVKNIAKVAFTNVNKVWGYSVSGNSYFRVAESLTAKAVLAKEIECIRPKYLLCCGTTDVVKAVLKNCSCKAQIIDMPHPGARIGKKKLLEKIQLQLQE